MKNYPVGRVKKLSLLGTIFSAIPGPELIKLFFCAQLSMKFIMLINVKMPTIVGILKFMRMINTTSKKILYFLSILDFMSS